MWNHPGGGGGNNLVEVAIVESFCFLCHSKLNNYAYTFAAGCLQKCLILSSSQSLSVPHIGVYG